MISPQDTFTIYLDRDTPEGERLPDAQRPALVYRFGTAAELREHERRVAALNHLHGEAYIGGVVAAASFNLVEARNLVKPDGTPTTDLAEAFTLFDLKALASRLSLHAELSEADRKKSESPSPSVAAASVETAPPAGSA